MLKKVLEMVYSDTSFFFACVTVPKLLSL
jgi:hypothetical protein